MAKKNTPEEQTKQKAQTKYDRKMEARKQQKIKDQRQEKLTKTVAVLFSVAFIAVIVVSIAFAVVKKDAVLNQTYVKVGEHDLTQLEYDYYYQTTVNNYLNTYASIMPYFGFDSTKDYDEQEYMDGMTWKDMFDEMTVEQIKQNKAMTDDAAKSGFTYDTTEDYENFVNGIKEAANTAGVSVSEYYKTNFGAYATEKNVEAFVKESLIASAYYDNLLEQMAPSDEEVKAEYEASTKDYDKVDYRSFTFTADLAEDASEEDISAAMDELKTKADSMMKARQNGTDFEELCIENASEDNKANYEDAETEYCLSEGKYYSGISAQMADWLFEDGRTEGDLTVIEDETSHAYYVVEFVGRYYDEADNEKISDNLASQKVTEYINSLSAGYDVTDVKGELKYLTIDTSDASDTDE
ncbi:MAG: hypothetical protein PUG54_11435 [Firmicutes bacterium]|nr:hypothetical protein [Bacillota bacterium]